MGKIALAMFAHPDDAEFVCAGTLSLLKKAGWAIHIATMTPGDKGTAVYSREEISEIRKSEASRSAGILGAEYYCLGFEDVYIMYERESVNRATSLMRRLKPTLVFTHSPADYMIDHEITSKIVQTACFATGIKNLEISDAPFEPVPFLYYADPMEGKDIFGDQIVPATIVNITTEIKVKEAMLACHASQRDWLLSHHRMDEYILSMKRFGHQRGQEIQTGYGEGFRQHLGHGYPQKNILKEVLDDLVTNRFPGNEQNK